MSKKKTWRICASSASRPRRDGRALLRLGDRQLQLDAVRVLDQREHFLQLRVRELGTLGGGGHRSSFRGRRGRALARRGAIISPRHPWTVAARELHPGDCEVVNGGRLRGRTAYCDGRRHGCGAVKGYQLRVAARRAGPAPGPALDRSRLRERGGAGRDRRGRTATHVDTYLDTRDRALDRAGYSLRIRHAGRKAPVATVKSLERGAADPTGPLVRLELEEAVDGLEPATLSRAPGPSASASAPSSAGAPWRRSSTSRRGGASSRSRPRASRAARARRHGVP